jgi:hypothetical protein
VTATVDTRALGAAIPPSTRQLATIAAQLVSTTDALYRAASHLATDLTEAAS